MFENGISWYTIGTAEVTNGFPEGEIKCKYCDWLKYEEAYKRYTCRLTREYIMDPFSYERGRACPMKFEKTEF